MTSYNIYSNPKTETKVKMFDYQREVLIKIGRDTLICNWTRGLGATYTIVATILELEPMNVLYVGNGQNCLKYLKDKCEDIFKDSSFELNYSKEKIEILINDNTHIEKTINIYNYNLLPLGHDNLEFDIIFFDGILPTQLKDIKTKRTVSFITTNNHDNHLEKLFGNNNVSILNEDYNTGLDNNLFNKVIIDNLRKNSSHKDWYEQFAIMSDPNESFNNLANLSKNVQKEFETWKEKYEIPYHMEFDVKTLLKLQEEYENIPEGSNTTKTRETLLQMINRIHMSMNLNQKETLIKPMYVDYVSLDAKNDSQRGLIKISIYVDNQLIILDSKYYKTSKDFAEAIYKLAKYNKHTVYIDTHGYGMVIYDELIKFKDLQVVELRVK